ncbi:HalOD1 output domain-containing protein [Natrialbaceae archaeon A-arb3/5]
MGDEAFKREMEDDAITAVVEAVAAATDERPKDLEPLHNHVDGDALNQLTGGNGDVQIQFSYEGCNVVVDDEVVQVEPFDG